jgi:hypothetical protein
MATEKASTGQHRLFFKPNAFAYELPIFYQAFSPGSPELQKYIVGVSPRMLGLPDDCPMAAPGVSVQFFDGLYDVGTKGVQVDVSNKGKKVSFFVAEDGFVPIFEQVTGALMAAIKILGVPGEEFSHDSRDAMLAAFEEQVDMIVHEDPSVDGAFTFGNIQA